MKIVLDTNVLLMSLPVASPYRSIFDRIGKEEITLAINNEILWEYEEILSVKTKPEIAFNVINYLLRLNSVELYSSYFKFNLITADVDDNKFVDCAITSQSDYLVTNDKHFDVLKEIPFPKVNVISASNFLNIISNNEW